MRIYYFLHLFILQSAVDRNQLFKQIYYMNITEQLIICSYLNLMHFISISSPLVSLINRLHRLLSRGYQKD
jgi:hypothetical protein